MAEKLVSVVIPVRNGEAHLASTLEAVIGQDYGSVEIIVVDDASTDSTGRIARTVLEAGGRSFKLITNAECLGVSAARNRGLVDAGGFYVWFCDGDDMPGKTFVSSLLAEAEARDADAVFCSIKHYYEDDGTFKDELIPKVASLDPEKYLEAWADGIISFCSVWNFLFRRDFLVREKLRFVRGCIYGEDTEFVLKAIAAASRVSSVSEMLYTYVYHCGQTTKKHKESEMFRSLVGARLRACSFVAKHTSSRKVRNFAVNYCVPDILVKSFTKAAQDGDEERYGRLVRSLKNRKMRGLLLSSAKYVLKVPELFFKAALIIIAPSLYFSLRRKK